MVATTLSRLSARNTTVTNKLWPTTVRHTPAGRNIAACKIGLGSLIIKFFMVLAILLAPVLAARLAYSVKSPAAEEPVYAPWAQNSMEFVTWNGEEWTSWIRDENFEHRPQNTDQWSQYSTGSVAFMDWENTPWQAKIEGDRFLLAHHGDWQGHIEHASAIRYRDWHGNNQLRTVAQLTR